MVFDDLPQVPFTARSAAAHGVSRARLRRAVRNSEVRRPLHGVYLRADVKLTTELKLQAAALVVHPDSVACDRTAAWLWGVGVFEFRELDDVPPVETYVLRGRCPTDRREVRGGTRDLQPSDWVQVDGVKVTTPVRTALDLGCGLNRQPALAAMDALMRAQGFSHRELAAEVPRFFRRRGVVQLRELVPLVDSRAESPPESWARLALHDAGLPTPEVQWWVYIDAVPTYRLDLAYPHARLAIEYDGVEFHTGRRRRERDRRRRKALRKLGWTVIVLTREDFGPDADHGWLLLVRSVLEAARRPRRRIYAR